MLKANFNIILAYPHGLGMGPVSGYPDTAQRQTSDTSPNTSCVRNIKAPKPNATNSHPGPDTLESWGSVGDFDGGPDWEMDII